MSRLPRIAVGALDPGGDCRAVVWGLLDLLAQTGRQVQHFVSKACFLPVDGATSITGLASRHLDPWLMSREVCRAAFVRAAAASDLSVVEDCTSPGAPGGGLDTLCQWLDLPRLAVLDASAMWACRLPARPERVDALLLDQVSDEAQFYRVQTLLESLWGLPVLGGMEAAPRLRAALAGLPVGARVPRQLGTELGIRMARWMRLDRLRALAARRPPTACEPAIVAPPAVSLRVAVAFDDAFCCYFPDTLDLLELHGAELIHFSPLRDESLPPRVDVVYLGCGHPEQHAAHLAANHCMTTALRNHQCAGRRVYAEGGGLAYLCRQIETPAGTWPMTGLLPAVARMDPAPPPPTPAELTLQADCWLGAAGAALRGYRNGIWRLEPAEALVPLATAGDGGADLVARHHAVGSRLHLNFAAQPEVFRGFLRPHSASLAVRPGPCGDGAFA
jgi:cobyrinic acid a,c-diamide synthase